MKISVYVASAFSKDHQGGNKAGVVFNEDTLTTTQKMAIAKELGYAEPHLYQHLKWLIINLSILHLRKK